MINILINLKKISQAWFIAYIIKNHEVKNRQSNFFSNLQSLFISISYLRYWLKQMLTHRLILSYECLFGNSKEAKIWPLAC